MIQTLNNFILSNPALKQFGDFASLTRNTCNKIKFLNLICPKKPKTLILLQVNKVNFTLNLWI
jgi:hypothetical protein